VGACHRSAQAWPGTFSLYTALDRATGKVIGSLHSRHRALEFKKFLQTLDQEVPRNLAVHLILETSSTHKTSAIQRWPLTHTSCSISPDLELRLNLSRALVSGVDHQAAASQRASLRASAQHRHPRLERELERGPTPVRLDQTAEVVRTRHRRRPRREQPRKLDTRRGAGAECAPTGATAA